MLIDATARTATPTAAYHPSPGPHRILPSADAPANEVCPPTGGNPNTVARIPAAPKAATAASAIVGQPEKRRRGTPRAQSAPAPTTSAADQNAQRTAETGEYGAYAGNSRG